MTRTQKIVLGVLLLVVAATAAALLFTRDWASSARRLHADQMKSARTAQQIVDTSALADGAATCSLGGDSLGRGVRAAGFAAGRPLGASRRSTRRSTTPGKPGAAPRRKQRRWPRA